MGPFPTAQPDGGRSGSVNCFQREAFWYSSTVRVMTSPTPRLSRLPAVAWCTAWACHQLSLGVKVSRPRKNPTRRLVAVDLKKEPCPQSWKRIKIRTRNAAAGMANAGSANMIPAGSGSSGSKAQNTAAGNLPIDPGCGASQRVGRAPPFFARRS